MTRIKKYIPAVLLHSFAIYLLMLLTGCEKDQIPPVEMVKPTEEGNAPFINICFPTIFREGDTVVIRGVRFKESIDSNQVFIGDSLQPVAVRVINASKSQLTVLVPKVTADGKIYLKNNAGISNSKPFYFSQWKQVSLFPGSTRAFSYSFAIGDIVYFGGGETVAPISAEYTGFLKDLYAYNTTTGQWQQRADFPGAGRSHAASFVINGKAYVGLGGSVKGNNYKDFYVYDPVPDQWKPIKDFPGTARVDATAFAVNEKGYIGQGASTSLYAYTYYQDFYSYTPATNSWVKLKNFAGGLARSTFSFVINGIPYVGLGTNASANEEDVFQYNLTMDSWVKIASPSLSVGNVGCFAYTINNKGYITTPNAVGGSGLYFPYSYDPATNEWQRMQRVPTLLYNARVYFMADNPLSAGDGTGGVGAATATDAYYMGRNNTIWHFINN